MTLIINNNHREKQDDMDTTLQRRVRFNSKRGT